MLPGLQLGSDYIGIKAKIYFNIHVIGMHNLNLGTTQMKSVLVSLLSCKKKCWAKVRTSAIAYSQRFYLFSVL